RLLGLLGPVLGRRLLGRLRLGNLGRRLRWLCGVRRLGGLGVRRLSRLVPLWSLGIGRGFRLLGLLLGDALGVDGLWLGSRRGRRDQLLVDSPAPLGHPRRLANSTAQVVELGPAHVAARRDLQLLDLWRMQRKRPLDANPEGLLADRESLARSR